MKTKLKMKMVLNHFKNFVYLFYKGLKWHFANLSLFKIAQGFFCLFFAFLPFQIDALLLTGEIYFSGFFNPYLSHFIYISDVFLILALVLLALSFLFERGVRFKIRIRNYWLLAGVALFFCVYLISTIFASNLLNSIIYSARVLQFIVVYFLISSGFINIKKLFYIFIGVVSFVGIVGIFQYILQESLGLRFLSEPIVSSRILGVAKVGLIDRNILRIYGTFPHPNIFAGYLLFAIFMIIYCLKDAREMVVRMLFFLLLIICLLATVLTFSRSGIMALFAGLLLYYTVSNIKISFKYVVFALVLFLFFIVVFDLSSVLIERVLMGQGTDFSERSLYLSISKRMFFENIFGVGAGNFTAVMQDYSYYKLLPWLFQPVHNIFLLTLNELGIQGGVIFLLFFISLFGLLAKNLSSKRLIPILMSLWAVIFVVGLFDHYFISLYQGQVLFWLFVGLIGKEI